MRPIRDLNDGRLTDYTDEIITDTDKIIECLELLKVVAHDDCPYTVEFFADSAKHSLREVCEIVEKVCDHYERTSEKERR